MKMNNRLAVAGGYGESTLHKTKISGLWQNPFRPCCVVAQLRNYAHHFEEETESRNSKAL
jgi:hypothetical protein